MKQNPLRKCPYAILALTKGFVAIVDKDIWGIVRRFHWHAHISRGKGRNAGQPYARTNINGKKVYLHRMIMDCAPGLHVDHKNHQTLDCRRENLENITHTENLARRRSCRKKPQK